MRVTETRAQSRDLQVMLAVRSDHSPGIEDIDNFHALLQEACVDCTTAGLPSTRQLPCSW
jgi:hypothetical protein